MGTTLAPQANLSGSPGPKVSSPVEAIILMVNWWGTRSQGYAALGLLHSEGILGGRLVSRRQSNPLPTKPINRRTGRKQGDRDLLLKLGLRGESV